jgi:hypothetical protein
MRAVRIALVLETQFVFAGGRITTTREPGGRRAPSFVLVRGQRECAWAVNADVADARELDALAREELPTADLRAEPRHADRYRALGAVEAGPCFMFPEQLAGETRVVSDERELGRFRGWNVGDLEAGYGPLLAIDIDGSPASICFCARRTDIAAEAGLETAAAYRGRGLAPLVTAAWACTVRASGRIPLYSTSWSNAASLAVARKLGLVGFAGMWSVG